MQKPRIESSSFIVILKPIVFWLITAWFFWLVEAVLIAFPEYLTFDSFKILATPGIYEPLLHGLLVYTVLFLVIGVSVEFAAGMLKRRFSNVRNPHPGINIFFQFIFAGTVTLHTVVLSDPLTEISLFWELGLAVPALISLFILIRMFGDKRFSFFRLLPAMFLPIWILPVYNTVGDRSFWVDRPVVYLLFSTVGLSITVLMVKLSETIRNRFAANKNFRGAALPLSAVAVIFMGTFVMWRVLFWGSTGLTVECMDNKGKKPNILLIVLDTVRADHLSCYGYNRPTTPTIDRLAEAGVLFENVMSASHWTLPSHASMFTGHFPAEHRATGVSLFLDARYPTMAQLLYRAGYQTAGFSANLFVGNVTALDRGFEYFEQVGSSRQSGRIRSVWARWEMYLDEIKRRFYRVVKSGAGKKKKVERPYPPAEKVVGSVEKWLEDERDPNRPFFIFINLMDAHLPYKPPSHKDLNRFLPDEKSYKKALRVNENVYKYVAGAATMTDEDFYLLQALYDAQIRYMDDRIEYLFGHLGRLNLWQETLVIVISDHGEYFGERNLMGHAFGMGYPTLNIPLIIKGLEGIEPGTKIESPVQNIDILPTVLDILSCKLPGKNPFPGPGLLKRAGNRAGYADAYPVPHFLDLVRPYSKEAAVRLNRFTEVVWRDGYEYIWASDGAREMYYLPTDAAESNNLILSNPGLADEMESEAKFRAKRFKKGAHRSVVEDFSEEEKERLRALGYIK